MNKTIRAIAHDVGLGAKKHLPELLIAFGVGCLLTGTVFAVKATPSAMKRVEDEKQRQNRQNRQIREGAVASGADCCNQIDRLKPAEVVKVTWKCYIPAAVFTGLGIGLIVGGSTENVRRNTALVTAYTVSENALREYQKKVVETVGEAKEKVVRDAIAQDKIEATPVSGSEVVITEKGNTLCFDTLSSRYFRSDIEKIKRVENNLNRQMRDDMYIALNDFYFELGLSPIGIGDNIGWNINSGYIDIYYSSHIADDGNPCIVLNYRVAPQYDYMRY